MLHVSWTHDGVHTSILNLIVNTCTLERFICPVYFFPEAMKMSLYSFKLQLQVSQIPYTSTTQHKKKDFRKQKRGSPSWQACQHWLWRQERHMWHECMNVSAEVCKVNKLHPDPGHKLWTWSTSGGELPEHLSQFSLQQSHQHWESNTSRDQVQQSRLGKTKQPL